MFSGTLGSRSSESSSPPVFVSYLYLNRITPSGSSSGLVLGRDPLHMWDTTWKCPFWDAMWAGILEMGGGFRGS
jgi:hypothetical protein